MSGQSCAGVHLTRLRYKRERPSLCRSPALLNVSSRLAAEWSARQLSSSSSTQASQRPPTTQLYSSDEHQSGTNFPAGFYNPSYNPSSAQPFLPMAQYNPTLGPFLPFSPTDVTFLRTTHPNDQTQGTDRSSSVSSTATTGLAPPRHFSTSAFPPTPLSVDPNNLPSGGGWTDRQASFAAAAAAAVGEDPLLWEEGERAGDVTPRRQGSESSGGAHARGGRRPRMVGRSFEEVEDEGK